jgi:hypothetical protein
MYLKDMRFFWYFNFAYRWSFVEKRYNTAVMGFNKIIDSSISELINQISKNQSSVNELVAGFHPEPLSQTVSNLNKIKTIYDYKPLIPLHGHFFDGAWLCHDGCVPRISNVSVCKFNEFYTKKFIDYENFRPENFFNGAYAYHIHFKESYKIDEFSYFAYFERFYYNFISNLNDTHLS